MQQRSRRLRTGLALAVAAVLAAGVTWGVVGALAAASPTPSASSGALILHVGWTTEPDNLEPVHRLRDRRPATSST